jgi:hypothetical protein
MALDYVGSYNASKGDELLHYGVKGMHWGVRNADRKSTKKYVRSVEDSISIGNRNYRNASKGSLKVTHKKTLAILADQNGVKLVGKKVILTPAQQQRIKKAETRQIEADRRTLKDIRGTREHKHLNNDKTPKGVRKFLVTDYTVSPYRSAGRLRRKNPKVPFAGLTAKQQQKLYKSLARDAKKIFDKKLEKSQRGKTDYLKAVKSNSKLRDQLIKGHGTLLKVGKRMPDETRRKYLTTLTNYPKVIVGPGIKSQFVGNLATIGIVGAMLLMSDDIEPNDYVGAARDGGFEHYGVKGMHWGIRNSRSSISGSPAKAKTATASRAHKKESSDVAKSKEIDRLVSLRDKVKPGGVAISKNGKKLSSDQAIKAINKDIERLSKGNSVVDKRIAATKNSHAPLEKTDHGLKNDMVNSSESSTARYARLDAHAKQHGPKSLDDEDLKFLNTRREALGKAHAAYAKPKSKLRVALQASITQALVKQLMNPGQLVKNVEKLMGNKTGATVPFSPGLYKFKVNTTASSPARAPAVFNITSMGKPDPYMSTSRTTILGQSLVRAG